jgi:hypothetical protein
MGFKNGKVKVSRHFFGAQLGNVRFEHAFHRMNSKKLKYWKMIHLPIEIGQ